MVWCTFCYRILGTIRCSGRLADGECATHAGFGKVLDDAKGGLLDDERIFLFDASDLLRVSPLPAFYLSPWSHPSGLSVK